MSSPISTLRRALLEVERARDTSAAARREHLATLRALIQLEGVIADALRSAARGPRPKIKERLRDARKLARMASADAERCHCAQRDARLRLAKAHKAATAAIAESIEEHGRPAVAVPHDVVLQ